MKKRFVAFLISFVMLIALIPSGALTTSAATTKTQEQAIAWLNSKVGTRVGSGQCVALIVAYYEYLGAPSPSGNGRDYATNPVPFGWNRIPGATPQVGDIMVWTEGLEGYGHVAICGGSSKYYHQNWDGPYVSVKSTSYTGGFSVGGYYANYWGVIRPDFSSSQSSISYESIAIGKYYIKNNSTGTYLSIDGGTDANTQNVSVFRFTGASDMQMSITQAPSGYKIQPLCSSSRLINPYADIVVSGKNVNLYDDVSDSSQWWGFQAVSGGYIIRNIQNQNCVLDISGTNILVSNYTEAASQIWSLVPMENYTVTYNANGGSGAPSSQTKAYGVNLTLSSVQPTRSGYTFLGWATSSTATRASYLPNACHRDFICCFCPLRRY